MAVKSRFLLDVRIGPRTLETAREMLTSVATCCRPGGPLLIEMDEHRPYPQAILSIFGVTRFRRRKRGRGRRKYPDLKPPPELMVGVVHKLRDESGRFRDVMPKRLFGRRKDIQRCLKRNKLGSQINTSHIERNNGVVRTQLQARLGRRTRNGSRAESQLEANVYLWRDIYHFVRTNSALSGQTPAVATGLADHPWSVIEYVRQPVHVGPFQRALWLEHRQKLLTTGLYGQKHLKPLPTS
jgi:hypothetical protein